MKAIRKNLVEVEIHQLKTSFASGRIQDRKAVSRLAESMSRMGQKMPLVAIAQEGHWILLDGYLRLAAAIQCGWDTVWVEGWDCDLECGVLQMLGGNQARRWEAVEEGYLIQDLIRGQGMSPKGVAQALGRDPSWVNRRLAMVEELPEEILKAVRQGEVPAWSASRVLVPMARANPEHTRKLVAALIEQPMSTRQLVDFFQHYSSAPRAKRERMIENPSLFVKTVEHQRAKGKANALRRGPEGRCLGTLRQLKGMMRRLRIQIQEVLASGDEQAGNEVLAAWDEVNAKWQYLTSELKRSHHDPITHPGDDPGVVRERLVNPGDQPQLEVVAQCGEEKSEAEKRNATRSRNESPTGAGSRPLQAMRGEPHPCPRDPSKPTRSEDRLLHVDPDGTRGPPA